MIIRQVSIHGFKTYAKKTNFIFDPGVTAVVGPNGSGKSNVVDAIRWCLGEQSFSLLRSKKTSDVIFSGSDRKSRLGMAQVTVTLDNSDGELPVDFTEVEITRRAYRDGNNEYLLNGQRVRLQDITEMLAPTGLGKRTYALIGQGLIERVLSMAPDDLRALFEEAAGITTQQTKRAAALRRLDAAQQNLTRVKDITAELSPRLGNLRRQAERAEQRNRIAEQLRELLETYYGYHWHYALYEYATRQSETQSVNDLVEQHRRALAALSEQIAAQRSQQGELRGRLAELHRASSVHHRESEQVGRELAVVQERHRQTLARSESIRQELGPLRLERETLTERIVSSETELQKLRRNAEASSSDAGALQAAVSEREGARRKLEAEMAEQREIAGSMRTALAEARSRSQQLGDRLAELEAEARQASAAERSASESAIAFNEQLETRKAELCNIEAQIAEQQSRLEAVNSLIGETRAQLEDATGGRQIADREVDRLQTRQDVLMRLRREGAGYASGVRSLLREAQSGRLQGVLGTVASALDVPPELDRAVGTALGDAYQNVIVQTWTNAQSAIEYLKATGNGRATLLPLDRLHILPVIPAPDRPGILGNAVELVKFDPQVSAAVSLLLNRVWIVETLDAARGALDSIRNGPRPTVVTIGGEIVRPGGAVTGGDDRRRRDDSVLARERELRELPPQLAQAKRVLEQRVAECSRLIAVRETQQQEVASLENTLHNLAEREREKRAEIVGLDKERERSTQALEWYATRVQEIGKERLGAESQVGALRTLEAESSSRLEEAENALRTAEEAANSSGLDTLQQRLLELRTASAEAQGAFQSHAVLLENQRCNLGAVEAQIGTRERQLATLNNESEDLRNSIDLLREKEDEAGARTEELQAEIRPAEATLLQLEQEQAKLEAEERTRQSNLRQAEIDWNAAQLAMQRAGDRIEQLRRDIEQEFSLVFVDDSEEEVEQPTLPWDSIVTKLTPVDALPSALEDEVSALRRSLSRLKNVNPDAPREYAEAAERCEFLETQAADLEEAIDDLQEVIAKLDALMQTELRQTFESVSEQFVHYFKMLFGGGTAQLTLTDSDNITLSGIEIVARPPGKRPQSLALLSGGERTLTACALIFAILRVSPTPFCVLDEVDAALDEANVDRFRFALEELSQDTQFILITHNRRTLEGTNAIYGVTMGSDGMSRVISLKLEGERIVRNEQSDAEGSPQDNDGGRNSGELAEIEELVQK